MLQIFPEESIFNAAFNLEVTLDGFQKWYDKKNPKTAKGKVSGFLIN